MFLFFKPQIAKLQNLNSTHLKLCLATATHNVKLVNITHICLIWDIPTNIDLIC